MKKGTTGKGVNYPKSGKSSIKAPGGPAKGVKKSPAKSAPKKEEIKKEEVAPPVEPEPTPEPQVIEERPRTPVHGSS